MKLPVEEARRLAEDVLAKAGLTAEQAQIVSAALLEAELRGRKGHGLIRLPGVVQHAQRGRGAMVLVKEGPHWASLDGGGEIGYLAAHHAMTLAVEKAKDHGTGLVSVRNASHYSNSYGICPLACKPRSNGLAR